MAQCDFFPPRQRKTRLTPQKRPFLSLQCLHSPGGDGAGLHVAGVTGRKLESSDFTARHLSGLGFRVLAFGLALLPLASRMTTRENPAGKSHQLPF